MVSLGMDDGILVAVWVLVVIVVDGRLVRMSVRRRIGV